MTPRTGPSPFETVRTDIADKVRKLLAQAEDRAATAEEARAFTAKAQELMTKYAIDVAMIADPDKVGRVVQRGWRIDGPYAGHKVTLVTAVGTANDCRTVYTTLPGGARYVDVVGFPDDVDWVEALSRSLELQLATALASAVRSKPPHVHGRTFAVGFVQGFVAEVATRLRAARRDAVARAERLHGATAGPGGSSVALVLVAKADRVDDEYRVRFPGARAVRRYVRLQSWSGYEPGRAAGGRARLARAPLGARRGITA